MSSRAYSSISAWTWATGLRGCGLADGEVFRRAIALRIDPALVQQTVNWLDVTTAYAIGAVAAYLADREDHCFYCMNSAKSSGFAALLPPVQVDDGDFAVGRRLDVGIVAQCFHYFGTPKRGFRLSSPIFSNVATMVLMKIVGCPSDRNCTRHVTALPLPFGPTSRTPV